MGRKSSKVNNSQPQRNIYTSSSGSSVHTQPQSSPTPTTVPIPATTSQPSIGDSVKQGMATGAGFAAANAAVNYMLFNIKESETADNINSAPKPITCESYMSFYHDCLKAQGGIMEDNCEYLLANFKKCTLRAVKNENENKN